VEGRVFERSEVIGALSPESRGCWRDSVVRELIRDVRKTVGVGRMRCLWGQAIEVSGLDFMGLSIVM